jgi:hypothetical protein
MACRTSRLIQLAEFDRAIETESQTPCAIGMVR